MDEIYFNDDVVCVVHFKFLISKMKSTSIKRSYVIVHKGIFEWSMVNYKNTLNGMIQNKLSVFVNKKI